jgi:hypothetical protein
LLKTEKHLLPLTIRASEIQEKLGSQEFPEILANTFYVTKNKVVVLEMQEHLF